MMINKAWHPRDDIERQYVSRKDGEREIASNEDSIDTSIRRLEDFAKKTKQKKIYYSNQKHEEHNDEQNKNN